MKLGLYFAASDCEERGDSGTALIPAMVPAIYPPLFLPLLLQCKCQHSEKGI